MTCNIGRSPISSRCPCESSRAALIRLAAKGARRIIAVSNAGAQEIVDGLRVDRTRIDVVPNGVRPPAASRSDGRRA